MLRNRGLEIILLIALTGCSYTPEPVANVPGSNVGGTGNVQYTHERLGTDKHLIAVTAAPGLGETEGSIAQRILIFANRFAAQECPKRFEFVNDPNFSQPTAAGFMKRTRTYVFRCA